MNLSRLGETGFWRRIASGLPRPPAGLRAGVGEKAVFKPAPGRELLATCDLLVEGVHFSLDTTGPWQLGAKALAVSLSDIAAMGGEPLFYLVSLAIPRRAGLGTAFWDAFYAGLGAWGGSFGAFLAGGDTSVSPGPLVIDLTLLGQAEKGRALMRRGARPGDLLFCTGQLGDSAAGLACLGLPKARKRGGLADAAALLEKRHLLPLPRVPAGRWLLGNRAATACTDVSDGLSTDLGHLAQAGGVGFEVEADAVPVSPAARLAARALRKDPLDWALRGGEDYELLFTAPPSKARSILGRLRRETGTAVSLIGRAVPARRGLRLRRAGRWTALRPGGWDHFKRSRKSGS